MKYLITGGSGYIGGRLTELLTKRDETERVINLDVRAPAVPWPKTEFVQGDVRDGARIKALLDREQPDALIHLAFLLNPIRDEGLMYDIDVNGTHAVLQAASEAGTEHVLVTSSAVSYGAWPDNPVPIAEDQPVRGQPDFSYARDKADADRVCQLWAADHSDRVMTIVRPTIVFGPNVDNYISRGWEKTAFMPVMDGVEQEFQLVHENDVVSAISGLLDAKAPGAFNLAADGTITWRESAGIVGLRVREMSFKTVYRLYGLSWKLHVPNVEAPAGNLHFLHNPWIVSNEKLKSTIGWEPTKTTREVFEETVRAKGLVEAAATPSVPPATPTVA
jgi:UDP-glucose 4-epimerase